MKMAAMTSTHLPSTASTSTAACSSSYNEHDSVSLCMDYDQLEENTEEDDDEQAATEALNVLLQLDQILNDCLTEIEPTESGNSPSSNDGDVSQTFSDDFVDQNGDIPEKMDDSESLTLSIAECLDDLDAFLTSYANAVDGSEDPYPTWNGTPGDISPSTCEGSAARLESLRARVAHERAKLTRSMSDCRSRSMELIRSHALRTTIGAIKSRTMHADVAQCAPGGGDDGRPCPSPSLIPAPATTTMAAPSWRECNERTSGASMSTPTPPEPGAEAQSGVGVGGCMATRRHTWVRTSMRRLQPVELPQERRPSSVEHAAPDGEDHTSATINAAIHLTPDTLAMQVVGQSAGVMPRPISAPSRIDTRSRSRDRAVDRERARSSSASSRSRRARSLSSVSSLPSSIDSSPSCTPIPTISNGVANGGTQTTNYDQGHVENGGPNRGRARVFMEHCQPGEATPLPLIANAGECLDSATPKCLFPKKNYPKHPKIHVPAKWKRPAPRSPYEVPSWRTPTKPTKKPPISIPTKPPRKIIPFPRLTVVKYRDPADIEIPSHLPNPPKLPPEDPPKGPKQKKPGKPGDKKKPVKPGQKPGNPPWRPPGKKDKPGKKKQPGKGTPGKKKPGKGKPGWLPGKPGKKPGKPGKKKPGKKTPGKPGKPGQPPKPGAPGQPKKPGDPAKKPGKPGQPKKPGIKKPGLPGKKPGKPGKKQPGKPGQKPPGKPGIKGPGKKPGKPGQKPPAKPGIKGPGKKPGKPGQKPGKPGQKPGKPGQKPGKPGQKPPTKPGIKGPGKKPGQKPGQKPGKPGQKPGQKPGIKGPGKKPPGKPGIKGPKSAPPKPTRAPKSKPPGTTPPKKKPAPKRPPGRPPTPNKPTGPTTGPNKKPSKNPPKPPPNAVPPKKFTPESPPTGVISVKVPPPRNTSTQPQKPRGVFDLGGGKGFFGFSTFTSFLQRIMPDSTAKPPSSSPPVADLPPKPTVKPLPPPFRVSPLIKLSRWSLLAAGIFYGAQRQMHLAAKEKTIREEELKKKAIRDAKIAEDRQKLSERDMAMLAKIFK